MKRRRELLEEVLSHQSLNNEQFQVLQPATEDDIEDLMESLSILDENFHEV